MRRDREHKMKWDRKRTENTVNTDIKRQKNTKRKGTESDRKRISKRDRKGQINTK